MKVRPEERLAIIQLVQIGKQFGFGNVLGHLKTAWSKELMHQLGCNEKTANIQADGIAYPIRMHDDIVNHGEWDETGERYAE